MRKYRKRTKLTKKTRFTWTNCKKEQFGIVFLLLFLHFWPREHGTPGFSWFVGFAVCVGVFCRFPYDRGLFSVISLHFLRKYRCVPKIGFSLGWHFPVNFFHFLQKYRCVLKTGFSADISIDIFIDIPIDILIDTLIDIFSTFLLTCLLTFVFYWHFWYFYWHFY